MDHGICDPACGAAEQEGRSPPRPEHAFVTEWCMDVEPESASIGSTTQARSAICADGERACSPYRPCQRHSA